MALWEWICGAGIGAVLTYFAINPLTENGTPRSAERKFANNRQELHIDLYGPNDSFLVQDPRNPEKFITEKAYKEATSELFEQARWRQNNAASYYSSSEFEIILRPKR